MHQNVIATNVDKDINLNHVGSESILKMLLENGADVNAVDKANNSALIFALSKGG